MSSDEKTFQYVLGLPEDSESVSAMAASLFSEASGVAHILEGQLLLLKPLVAVHGTQWLLTCGNQVLVVSLTYMHSSLSCLLKHHTLLAFACSTRCPSWGLVTADHVASKQTSWKQTQSAQPNAVSHSGQKIKQCWLLIAREHWW